MELSSILGIIVGVTAVLVGMVFKGANLHALINPAAFFIIIVGTTAALMNAFPMRQFVKLPTMFGLVFKGKKFADKRDIAREFVSMSQLVRREGILVLEQHTESMTDKFMSSGISMVVDGIEPQLIEEVLESQIEALQERHKLGAQIFAQAGMCAPTLGVLGAVIGLVAALGNLSDIERLGHAIAGAFIATLLGIFTGYVMWHPFSNKLKQINREEVEIKRMIVQGILAIQAGDPPVVVQLKMLAHIREQDRAVLEKEWAK